jgi:hypothetical protein
LSSLGACSPVEACQICDSRDLVPVLFLGFLAPPNQLREIGKPPAQQGAYPAQLLVCRGCDLAQLGLVVDKNIVFPPEYPYTSGTTRILRENFAELYRECAPLLSLRAEDLIVDIGSNDGTLLSNFKNAGHRVRGIEPTQIGQLARQRGIPTDIAFFDRHAARRVRDELGPATVITATNVFAHIERPHDVVEGILDLLGEKGVFVSESHYLLSLIETLQYDTVYHEHLRYYSLHSKRKLLEMHGLEVIHAKRIPTHGGSIRVYAARKGQRKINASVAEMLGQEERQGYGENALRDFRQRVARQKLALLALLQPLKARGARIFAVGAPSRASTLVNYVGLDDSIIDAVAEVPGSYKVGKYMPGTLIPVVDEARLFSEKPDYALMLSWHIADEIMPKLRARGYAGRFIVPLPEPRIVEE